MSVQVIKEALTDEAGKWRDLAGRMTRISERVAGLDLYPSAFYAGADLLAPTLLPPKYTEMQKMIITYLKQGSAEFTQVADALTRARELYERGDEEAARMNTRAIFGS